MPRLNKFIAHHAGLSRREADEAIHAGRVMVNHARAVIGMSVEPFDIITLNGVPLVSCASYTYLLLNKPAGYICSRRQQGDTPTIYSLLPGKFQTLKPVGRLDKDSSGLILLTNDGDFAHQMTHPGFRKTKTYEVQLNAPLKPLHQQMISDHGVALDDGVSKFNVTTANVKRPTSNVYSVTMAEGRNRQIRRTFAALGYIVTKLHRTTFGPYSLSGVRSGGFRLIPAPAMKGIDNGRK